MKSKKLSELSPWRKIAVLVVKTSDEIYVWGGQGRENPSDRSDDARGESARD